MFKVVCTFSGTVYSRHKSREAADRAADRQRRRLSHPNCGTLSACVLVVPAAHRFSRVVPADNDCGCVSLAAPVWTA